MKEARYFFVPDAANENELPAEEAQHAVRVLRLQAGDDIFLMDGAGAFHHAEVTLTAGKKCRFKIKEILPQQKSWNGNIHLAIAPTKMMERMEWMAEKATEVGFDELSFLHCKFSERKIIRNARVEKIIVSAVKQSRKPWKPLLNEMAGFKEFVTKERTGKKFIAHCYEEIGRKDLFTELQNMSAEEDVTILVGPEGDFSADEVRLALDNGYESITLGDSRLRTETAGLMAVTMAQITKRK